MTSDHQVLLWIYCPHLVVCPLRVSAAPVLTSVWINSQPSLCLMWRLSCAAFTWPLCLSFSDEQEAVQKRTFTKWINSHLAKVSVDFRNVLRDLHWYTMEERMRGLWCFTGSHKDAASLWSCGISGYLPVTSLWRKHTSRWALPSHHNRPLITPLKRYSYICPVC